MDTADDASGENVRPQIHENYDGEAVTLPATGTVTTAAAALKRRVLFRSDRKSVV